MPNPWSVTQHPHRVLLSVRDDGDRRARRAVLRRVLDQVARAPVRSPRSRNAGAADRARSRRGADAIRGGASSRSRHRADHLGDVVPLLLRPERPALDAGEVEEVADEPGQPIRLLVDRGQEIALRRVVPVHVLLQEAGRGRFDGGERRAQIVRDRREERGLQLVRLLERGGARSPPRSGAHGRSPAPPDWRRSSATGVRRRRNRPRVPRRPPARRPTGAPCARGHRAPAARAGGESVRALAGPCGR